MQFGGAGVEEFRRQQLFLQPQQFWCLAADQPNLPANVTYQSISRTMPLQQQVNIWTATGRATESALGAIKHLANANNSGESIGGAPGYRRHDGARAFSSDRSFAKMTLQLCSKTAAQFPTQQRRCSCNKATLRQWHGKHGRKQPKHLHLGEEHQPNQSSRSHLFGSERASNSADYPAKKSTALPPAAAPQARRFRRRPLAPRCRCPPTSLNRSFP